MWESELGETSSNIRIWIFLEGQVVTASRNFFLILAPPHNFAKAERWESEMRKTCFQILESVDFCKG